MVVAILVVQHGAPLYALLGGLHRHEHGNAFGRRPWLDAGLDRELQRVEQAARVAVRDLDQVLERPILETHTPATIAALGIGESGQGRGAQVIVTKCVQLEHPRAGHESLVHLEEGVLGGGAYQDDRAVFDVWQQGVLLGLVPAVYLIDEQDGLAVVQLPLALGRLDGVAYRLHARQHRVDGQEPGLGGVGYDARQCRLAGARRTREYYRRQPVALYGAAQQAARADDVVLAYEFIEPARPHPVRQRPRRLAGSRLGEQIVAHAPIP